MAAFNPFTMDHRVWKFIEVQIFPFSFDKTFIYLYLSYNLKLNLA